MQLDNPSGLSPIAKALMSAGVGHSFLRAIVTTHVFHFFGAQPNALLPQGKLLKDVCVCRPASYHGGSHPEGSTSILTSVASRD